jgi:hypothetical protein
MNAASIAQTLRDKGQAMTLTRVSAGTYDPVAGTTTGSTTSTYTVYGITKSFAAGLTNRPDSLILSGDKQAIIDAVSVVPLPGDTLTIKGVVWQVIAVDATEPDTQTYFYKLQVRK